MNVGHTRHQSMPGASSALWRVVGPMGTVLTYLELYKYSKIAETLGESKKYFFYRCKFQNHEIQSRGLFQYSAGEATIMEGFFIILATPSMMR